MGTPNNIFFLRKFSANKVIFGLSLYLTSQFAFYQLRLPHFVYVPLIYLYTFFSKPLMMSDDG